MGWLKGNASASLADMVAEELAVTAETTVVKTAIKKSFARTQLTAAKKKKATKKPKKAKKAKKAKKPKAKKKKKKKKKKAKKKKKKKKKAKKTKYVGGKRAKGQHKSKASIAAGKKTAAMMKKKGIGLFAVKTFSADLASIVGKTKGTRPDAFKGVWAYIKKKGLNKGKMISADATLKKVFGGGSMFKLAGAMTKHIK